MIKVSVVVPVYNPGKSLHRCVDSLLGQSLPADSIELIFVDDGSTDGSGAWLSDLAARHSQVQVIHEPNSGWAGRPRNVGLAAATGEFVQFVDQDDALGPEALERLVDYGTEHRADIVIGKVTSDFRRVPHELYRENVPRCSIRDVPLIRGLTPHKMFRRDFLNDHGLRFPEGRRRLEDQLFVVQAFFATDAVAILADYPCYFFLRRDDDGHSAKLLYKPADYYGNLREVLDVIAANTVPGEFRDGLHEKFLNAMVRKIRAMAKPGREERFDSFLTEIHAVIVEAFSPQVLERPSILHRQLVAAMMSGKRKKIRSLGRRYEQVTGRIHALQALPSSGGGWAVSVSASLGFQGGAPVRFEPEGDMWRIGKRLRAANLDVRPDAAEELVARASGDLILRSRKTGVLWLGQTALPATLEPTPRGDGHHLVVSGTVELDPATFAAGLPLRPDTWDVLMRISAAGMDRSVPVRRQAGVEVPRPSRRFGAKPRFKFRRDGRLVLIV